MDRPQHAERNGNSTELDSDEFALSEGEPLQLSEMTASTGFDVSEYLDLFPARDSEVPSNILSKTTTQRKRTYEQRKDEMDILAKQIALLEAKLDFLKHRAGIPDQQSIAQQTINNVMLREMLRNQQYLVAGLKSSIARDTSEHVLSPISMAVNLGSDPAERRAALLAMKPQLLHDGMRFMEKRAQFNCPVTRFSESTRFQNSQGDTFAVTFDIFPLHHAKSVKQVYDAVVFNWFNLEICMADLFGDVTVREEDDTGDESVSQHRLVVLNRHGIAVETNAVLFSDYSQRQHQEPLAGEEAIFVSDFVDSDALYPYRPQERVRKDVTSIMTIKLCHAGVTHHENCTDGTASASASAGASTPLLVLTRWVQSKQHKSAFEIPDDQLVELTEESNRAAAALLSAVCTSIQSEAASP